MSQFVAIMKIYFTRDIVMPGLPAPMKIVGPGIFRLHDNKKDTGFPNQVRDRQARCDRTPGFSEKPEIVQRNFSLL